ncbi:MAG: hypothetical protein UY05_C0015G0002 [Candidatus Peregrinibacteria bacterium GW2011_GWA2_47_7]|nr:MAG: hypothetical protein UY05_C0015G0002 [Candidatus Peregrinibacteria bacterium GW2011_GWA2_47_7]
MQNMLSITVRISTRGVENAVPLKISIVREINTNKRGRTMNGYGVLTAPSTSAIMVTSTYNAVKKSALCAEM